MSGTTQDSDQQLLDILRLDAAELVARAAQNGGNVSEAGLLAAWADRDDQARAVLADVARTWNEAPLIADASDYPALLGAPGWQEHLVRVRAALAEAVTGLVRRPIAIAVGVSTCSAALALMFWPSPENAYEATGSERQIILADTTTVRLGPNAWMETDFTGAQRLVRFGSGEGSFAVAKDSSRPFVVVTGNTRIQVVGTKFELINSAGCTAVLVKEGVVDVSIAGGGMRRLRAGEETVGYKPDGPTECAIASARFSYDNATLATIVRDANQFRNGGIVIAGTKLGNERLSTSFSPDQIDLMLGSLPNILPLRVEYKKGGVVELAPIEPDRLPRRDNAKSVTEVGNQ